LAVLCDSVAAVDEIFAGLMADDSQDHREP
jgi:hypothetical protein